MTKKGQETIKHYTEINDNHWKTLLPIFVMAPISFALVAGLYLFVFYVVPVTFLWLVKGLILLLYQFAQIL